MSLHNLASNKTMVFGGLAFLVFVLWEFTNRANDMWAELPVITTKKVSVSTSAPAASASHSVYPVFVAGTQLTSATSASHAGADAATPAAPPSVQGGNLDRLFSLDQAKSATTPGGAKSDGDLQMPNPGVGGNKPPGAPPGAGQTAEGEAGKSAPNPMPPPNLFRIDGYTQAGAFITGRYFKVGDELVGIAFPIALKPGEKAYLTEVTPQKIAIKLGEQTFVLTRGGD